MTWQVPQKVSSSAPTGAAGGSLSGTYPNPVIANNAVIAATIATAAVTAVKISDGNVTAVKLSSGAALSGAVGIADGNGAVAYAALTAAQVTGAAPLASPTFTGTVTVPAAIATTAAPRLNQLSPVATITSGALPTVQLVSTTGVQISTTRDVSTYTAVTYNSLIATNATCKFELSPDSVTYSTLATVTKPVGVAFAGEIGMEHVRVPAGWYLRATTTQAVLGLTTYA